MKIKEIKIQNFKCLGPDPIVLDFSDNIIVLIGENNVGKSSILSALSYFFSGIKTIPVEYFYNQQTDLDHAITITVTFCGLTIEEMKHKAIAPYIFNQNGGNYWTLKKVYYSNEGKTFCDYYAVVNGKDKKNPAGLSQISDDLFTEEKMQKIYVEAIKSISEVTEGNSKTIFNQLFNLILREDLERTEQFQALLNALNDYGNLFRGETQLPKVKEIEEKITEKLSRIIPAKSLIEAQIPKIDKILPTPNLLTNDGRDINPNPGNQGHGLQRALIFSLLELFAETKSPCSKTVGPCNLLLIEEPEIYMHPQMIRKITNVLYEIANQNKAQVILTTHSPLLINIIEQQKSLVRLVRQDDNSLSYYQQSDEIFPITDRANAKKRLDMLIRFDPTVNELFFAKRVVLLEGDSDFIAIKETGRMLNYFQDDSNRHKREDTTLINCRSRDSIPFFQNILNHFKIDYVVIHDTEGKDPGVGVNGKILKLLNNDKDLRKTFSPKIEGHLGIQLSSRDNKILKIAEKIDELNQSGQLENKLGEYIKFAYSIE